MNVRFSLGNSRNRRQVHNEFDEEKFREQVAMRLAGWLVANHAKMTILTGIIALRPRHYLFCFSYFPFWRASVSSSLTRPLEHFMLQKSILAVALIGVLVWTVTCGRSRTPQPSDTPVPTLTALATATDVPSQTPTPVPSVTPTVAEPTVEATPEAAVSETMTATDAITATTEIVTESATISEASAITEAETLVSTPEATATEEPSETTPEAPSTEEATAQVATVTTATLEVAATEEATETPTLEATTVVTESESVEPSATPPLDVEASATAEVTETVAVSETGSVSETSVLTETGEVTESEATVSTPSTPVDAQPVITLPTDLATSVQISSVTLLTDLVKNVLPAVAELSPDGTKVAWLVAEEARRLATLCIADITGGGQNCFTAEGYQGLPYHLVWSPNGEWLAFSEDPSAQALESDIWLFDVVNEELTNRTDDQTVGHYADAEGEFALDYLPMWNPANGALYFWRSTPDPSGGFALDLMYLDPDAAGDEQVVRALGQRLGDGVVRFGWQRFYLQGPSAMSPDGTQVAVSIAPAQEMDLSSRDGLWLIDLTNADLAPRQVATSFAWQAALPHWANQPAVARGLQWTADGKGLVVAALSSDLRLPLLLAYTMDVASGDVTPVVDFSDSRERDAFFRLDASGHAPRFDVPWTIALVPNANVLLMVTDLAGGVRILGAPLPPTGEAPAVLFEQSSPGYEVWTRSSNALNGSVLVYGLLVESTPLGLTPD